MKSGVLVRAVALVLSVIAFLAFHDDGWAQANIFSGRVVDEDGNPVPGVKVVAWNYGLADGPLSTRVQWETTSVADGIFTLQGLGPGANSVVFLKEGLLARSRRGQGYVGPLLFPRSDGIKEGVEICMERPEFVSGTVVDESGDPVAGAEVRTDVYQTTTAADGSFTFPAAVAQYAAVTAPGYRRCSGGYQPDAPEPWTITLTKGLVVSGRVLDAATGDPIEGARLFHRGMRTEVTSGPDGRYRLDQLHPTRTDVLVWKGDLIAKVKFEPYDGKSLDAADILVDKGGTIEGRITDKETGQPLEGVPVSIWEINPGRWLFARQATTGPDGRYRITGVLPGNMNVVPDQFKTRAENFFGCVCAHVEPGELVSGVDFEIGAALDPESVPCITGRVLDDKGDPVPSAALYLFDRDEPDAWDFWLSTDITGEFSSATMTFTGQPSALETDKPYAIEVLGLSLAVTRLENVVIPGETLVRQLTITLHNGARVTGTVRDLDGQPIADVAVLACAKTQAIVEGHKLRPNPSFAAPRILGATTAQDGTYEVLGLAPGTWLVGICFPQTCQPTNGPHEIQIEGEKPVTGCDFTARLLKIGSLEGTVVDQHGAPLPHAEVKAHCREPVTISRSVWSDAQGRFEFDSLPEAEYKLSAEREDGYDGRIENAKIGASGIVITARSGTSPKDGLIHGRVVNAQGKPITQFEVKSEDGMWWATYHSPSGKFAALMMSLGELRVSAPGYETKEVRPDAEAVQGSEALIVLEPEGS